MRFIRVFAIVVVLAGIGTSAAYALAFADQDYFWPNGEVGTPYYKKLIGRIDLGPCTTAKCKFRVIAGQLPPGLTLHSEGIVDGIPTQLGVYDFWLELDDCCGQSAQREFSINVNSVKLRVTTPTLPAAIRGVGYSQTLAASGGSGAGYTWSVADGKVPDGLTLNPDGTITGTPTITAAFTFSAKVTDSTARTDTHQFTINVVEPLGIKAPKRIAEVGIPFSETLAGTGGSQPYTWSVGGTLPAGVTFDVATGSITGTPTVAGSAPVTITMTDANALTKTLDVRFLVVPKLAFVTKRLDSATVGGAYDLKLTIRGGARPFRWSVVGGKLPTGIRLNTKTGMLSGHARAAGTARVRLGVKDGLGATTTRSFVLSVH